MTTLTYRSFVDVDSLAVDECTIHRCSGVAGRWWILWARVLRETSGPRGSAGEPMVFGVAVTPNGPPGQGPGGKTWALAPAGPGRWQANPSINVLVGGDIHQGEHPEASQWHQTPAIVGVPTGETWAIGEAP